MELIEKARALCNFIKKYNNNIFSVVTWHDDHHVDPVRWEMWEKGEVKGERHNKSQNSHENTKRIWHKNEKICREVHNSKLKVSGRNDGNGCSKRIKSNNKVIIFFEKYKTN